MSTNESDLMDRVRNITNASARNGVVIYTLDSRGLPVVGVGDASNAMTSDANQFRSMHDIAARYAARELSQSQEPLRMISANTGGRALLNSNSLKLGFAKAIQETSTYYLLAWRPESGASQKAQFRQLEVRVVGRPDLNVQVRRGYYDVPPNRIASTAEPVKAAPSEKLPQTELKEAIRSPYPTKALPTQLGLYYLNTPDKGIVLTASIQIARQFMTFSHSEDKQSALLDLTGVVLNDQGKPVAGFTDRLNVDVYFPQYVGQPRRDLIYNFQSPMKAGLYQVRVAVRDAKGGRTGSAMQWIEIPDVTSRRLSLSSLILAETTKDALAINDSAVPAESLLSVDRRFSRTSKLRLMTYIYNAAVGANASPPDVVTEMQILRDDQPITTTSPRKVQTDGLADPTRLAYAAEIPLESLLPGRYVLQIKVTDRIANTIASQRADFEIE
jgi:Flp pilus assembly protein TadG